MEGEYPSTITYVRWWGYASYMICMLLLRYGINVPTHVVISATIGISIICLSYNLHALYTFKRILKPIDDALEYLYYYDKSTVIHRTKIVIELLYIRQIRADVMKGTMFEDKTYPHIDNFDLLKCLNYKLKGIVPDEFWVQK